MQKGDVIALFGTLAAGKTTLTKGIAEALEIQEPVTSPTYTIVSEYEGKLPLYHLDTYRLSGEDEALTIGIEELLYGNGVCVIEWSERIQNMLPPHTIRVHISILATGERKFVIDSIRYEERLRQ